MEYALPYCVVAIVFLIGTIRVSPNDKITNYYLQRFVIYFIWIFFIGFRGFIVTDWQEYYPKYNQFPTFFNSSLLECLSFSKNHFWETGFVLFSIFIKSFGCNFFVYQVISVVLDVFVLTYVFDKYSMKKYFSLCFFLYFVFQGFVTEVNLLRNSKAMILFFLSIDYINKRDAKRYFALNILGFFFHRSAIFYFPLYWVLRVSLPKKVLCALFFLGNIIFLLQVHWIGGVLDKLMPLFEGTSYYPLLKSYGIISGNFGGYDLGLGVIERTVTFIIVIKFQEKLQLNSKTISPYINLMYCYLFIFLYLSEVGIFVARISNLFIIAYPIIYSNIYSMLSKGNKIILFIALGVYGFLKMLAQCDEPCYGYESYLFTVPNYNERLQLLHK